MWTPLQLEDTLPEQQVILYNLGAPWILDLLWDKLDLQKAPDRNDYSEGQESQKRDQAAVEFLFVYRLGEIDQKGAGAEQGQEMAKNEWLAKRTTEKTLLRRISSPSVTTETTKRTKGFIFPSKGFSIEQKSLDSHTNSLPQDDPRDGMH